MDDLVTVVKRGINTPGLTRGLLGPTPASLKVVLPQPGGPPIVRDHLQGWFVHGEDGPFAPMTPDRSSSTRTTASWRHCGSGIVRRDAE